MQLVFSTSPAGGWIRFNVPRKCLVIDRDLFRGARFMEWPFRLCQSRVSSVPLGTSTSPDSVYNNVCPDESRNASLINRIIEHLSRFVKSRFSRRHCKRESTATVVRSNLLSSRADLASLRILFLLDDPFQLSDVSSLRTKSFEVYRFSRPIYTLLVLYCIVLRFNL